MKVASDRWEADDKFAKLYQVRKDFAYGADEKRWSEN